MTSASHSTGTEGPHFEVPPGACDCHMHLFDPALPFAPGPVLRHAEASAAQYRQLQHRLRLERCVLVQPSSYGRDHRVLVAGLERLGSRARGIAVIDPSASAQELEELQAHGVVGVRFNLVQAGATHEGMLEQVARLIQPFGWHVQLHAHPADLVALADRLLALPVPVVLDHFARVHCDPAMSRQVAGTVSRLLASGKASLKLSAPYIANPGSQAHDELEGFVRGLVSEFPEQLVWGTDWPHVTEPAKPDDAALMDLLARWLPAGELHRVLVENPARLYRFPFSD